MKKVALILAALSLNYIPVFAQGIDTTSDEFKARKTQLILQYQSMGPEGIWQEYITSESTHWLAANLHLYKEPYFSWGIEELLKREPQPKACGMVLSREEFVREVKDLFFKRCANRLYTFEELQSMISFATGIPPIYMQGFIDKVLENWNLPNSQLADLVVYSPLPEQRVQIISRMNLSISDGFYACQIKSMEIPGYSELLEYLCDTYLLDVTTFDWARWSALQKMIMKKGS